MNQVLTVPRRLDDRGAVSSWSYAVKGLFLLPLLIQATIVIYDSLSFRYGWTVSPVNTIVGTALSITFLVAIAGLTFLSFLLSGEIDGIWRGMADAIESAQSEERPESND